MRQLVDVGPRRVECTDAPEPSLSSATRAIVRPVVVSTCDMDAVATHAAFAAAGGASHIVFASRSSVLRYHAADDAVAAFTAPFTTLIVRGRP